MRVMAVKATNSTHSLMLATDFHSKHGAEESFYLIRSDGKGGVMSNEVEGSADAYKILDTLGSSREGGLGSVLPDSLVISPIGKYAAFTDTEGRLSLLNIEKGEVKIVETWIAEFRDLKFSPGGRYLGFTHNARNQFTQISIIDVTVDSPTVVHATSDRFNCASFVWGDNAIYFLSDRDVNTDVPSPWGTRAPAPHLDEKKMLFGLDLVEGHENVFKVAELQETQETGGDDEGGEGEGEEKEEAFDFGNTPNQDYMLARKAYVIGGLAPAKYRSLISFAKGTLLISLEGNILAYDLQSSITTPLFKNPGMCESSLGYVWCTDGKTMMLMENGKVELSHTVDLDGFAISVQPKLEVRPSEERSDELTTLAL